MPLREFQDRRPALALALVLLAIAACFATWWFYPRQTAQPQKMAYFYDLNTGELFSAPSGTAGPIETDSGPYQGIPAGVRAHVFCCGPYLEGTEKFVGYVEVPLAALPEDQRPPGMELDPETEEQADYVVRRLDDDRWHNPDEPDGLRIMDMKELRQNCPEGKQLNYLPALSKSG